MANLRLGLVCISEILKKNGVGFKTMTRKSFNGMPRDKALETLGCRILNNTVVVNRIIQHLAANGISHYRVSSSMFPLITDTSLEIDLNALPNIDAIRSNLKTAGAHARHKGISVSCHPDQFNVLSSYNQSVVDRTINELNHQSNVLDMMGYEHSLASPMCLHLNCNPKLNVEDLCSYKERFISNLSKCNHGVQSRIVLENEDKGFWNCANLYNLFHDTCALVYDNLHDRCNPSENSSEDNAAMFARTWGNNTPVFHWSEGIGDTPKHAKRASHVPNVVLAHPEITWEVELKDKDYAILDILNNSQIR